MSTLTWKEKEQKRKQQIPFYVTLHIPWEYFACSFTWRSLRHHLEKQKKSAFLNFSPYSVLLGQQKYYDELFYQSLLSHENFLGVWHAEQIRAGSRFLSFGANQENDMCSWNWAQMAWTFRLVNWVTHSQTRRFITIIHLHHILCSVYICSWTSRKKVSIVLRIQVCYLSIVVCIR